MNKPITKLSSEEKEQILTENENRLIDEELAKSSTLTPRQELFCQLYAKHEEFFGNGTQAYIEAYGANQNNPNWYNVVRAASSRLLSNVNIIDRINEILQETGFNDQWIDKQLSFLVTQHADLPTKLNAIKEYNKLKARITEKVDHTTGGKPLPTPIYGGNSIQ